jgi:hypothetical protein
MDDKIGLHLEVLLENAESVEHLRDVLKSAKDAAVQFGEGTPEFEKFTNIAAKAKDQIVDLNKRVNDLDPSARLKLFRRSGKPSLGACKPE